MIKSRYFLASTLFHCLPLLLIFFIGAGGDGGEHSYGGNTETTGNIIAKSVDVEIVMSVDEDGIEKKEKKKPSKGELTECIEDRWYGGIGITQNFMDNSLLSVAPGYPAFKAGLLIGDIILETSEPDIRGEPGTLLSLKIHRPSTGETLLVNLRRDRICIDK